MSEEDPSRRNVLRGIAGAGALGLGGGLSVSIAAADGTADPVTLLDGEEKMGLARDFATTDAFQRLARQARELGYRVAETADLIDAGRTEAEGFQREVVAFELQGVEGSSRGGIVLSRDPRVGGIEMATLDIEHYDETGLFAGMDKYVAKRRGADAAVDEVTKETHVPNEQAVDDLIAELESTEEVTKDLDFPDVLDVSTCDGCYFAAGIICKKLCGKFGSYVCSLLGISVVGTIGCAALVKVVCWLVDHYTGCGDTLAATLCKSGGIDICPDSAPGDPINVDLPYI